MIVLRIVRGTLVLVGTAAYLGPLTFSKAQRYHRWMSWLSVGLYNFCRGQSSLKSAQYIQVQHRSPAMAARLTDHI